MASLIFLLTTAQAAPDTLTLAEARALPTQVLARRVLGAAGVLIGSAHVSGGVGMFNNPYRLAGIVFATAPRPAGFAGLCQVDIYTVRFRPVGGEQNRDLQADLPSHVIALDRATRFRSVNAGPPPPRGWDDTYGKAMEAACPRTEPVLRADGSLSFFVLETDDRPDARGAAASTALAVLAAAAAPARDVALRCETMLPTACRRRVRELAGSAPDYVKSGPCENAPQKRCVEARYDLGWLHWLTLTVESDAGRSPTAYFAPPMPVRAVRVIEVHAIE